MRSSQDFLDSLERTLSEIDALEAIYGSCDEDETDDEFSFRVVSVVEVETARSTLEHKDTGKQEEIPTLEIEIKVMVDCEDGSKSKLLLRSRMPSGYPEVPALVTVSADAIRRTLREELSSLLTETSQSMAGSESTMALVEQLKELGPTFISKDRTLEGNGTQDTDDAIQQPCGNSRRWIWVHHIKNVDRRKAIVDEARNCKLGGYLKHGYPGIIVIEGLSSACDEFVAWVKGSKSRPGGFGRNWGHHVRGQVDLDDESSRSLPSVFRELDDMAELGSVCREHGVEAEFLEFAMQHRAAGANQGG
eukprot:scaffold1184_cov132-Cylindrotheca_fusiformis.AAC.75